MNRIEAMALTALILSIPGMASPVSAQEQNQHTVLCYEALLHIHSKSASDIMGFPDDLKLKSSMTLFAGVSKDGSVFQRVLDNFFEAESDQRTLDILTRKSAKWPDAILDDICHEVWGWGRVRFPVPSRFSFVKACAQNAWGEPAKGCHLDHDEVQPTFAGNAGDGLFRMVDKPPLKFHHPTSIGRRFRASWVS